jgi:hypothetical protein
MSDFLDDMSLTPQEEELLKTIWGQRELNLDFLVMPQWLPETLSKNLEYISNTTYPFLQIINTSSIYSRVVNVKFYHTSSGWIIHDYGDAMSSSPPHEVENYLNNLLARSAGEAIAHAESLTAEVDAIVAAEGGEPSVGEGEGSEGGEGGVGDASGGEGGEDFAGSIIKQQADVAYLLVELAKKKGWTGVEMVAGTKLMQKYAWIAAQLQNVKLNNYSPTAEDRRSLDRVKELKQTVKRRPVVVPVPGVSTAPSARK